ncbi:phosphotransferase [Phenylobacterium sp.]|uniref:phosphotransferase n=1 Tax=Phenylobacterium sp. TaxID=1871053 RepID=UPI002C0D976B|nr:phosphotransferase [Phenylobacterium sp.]HVI31202.1 phosphotransferase [Phenylobacterium sp.]
MRHLIPSEKLAAVEEALLQAFGTAAPDAPPRPMIGGMSGARLFRIRVGGIPYILRLEPERAPPFGDPVRAHACMRIAAEACLAPPVRYADAATGVVIMDLIAEQPLTEYRGDLMVELGQSARLLHETKAFPPLVDYLAGMDVLLGWFRVAGLVTPEADELFERFAAFRDRYATPEADLVSSHNDLNARNVLYDGRRLWLIDWDAAFLADRYVDLAGLANWFGAGAEDTERLLATYFRASPTEAQRARLWLMRQVNHLFYGVMFALSGAELRRPADIAGARGLAELRADLAGGRLDLHRAGVRLEFGAALLAEALAGFRSAGFGAQLARAA